jgi:hypothetical protein
MTEQHTWEQSVEKARLAGLKTFEGRLEIARASFEQIPPNGKGVARLEDGHSGERTLADFALDADIEYRLIEKYRSVAKWWGDSPPLAGIAYSTAREAMGSGKWRTGQTFVAFTLRTDPPEGHRSWTLDALREHLGLAMTNTGRLAQKIREGGKVKPDEVTAAVALDQAAESAETIRGIEDKLTATVTSDRAKDAVGANRPDMGGIFDGYKHDIDEMLGPLSTARELMRKYLKSVDDAADWLTRHGDVVVGGKTGDEDDTPEPIRDIYRDAFAEDLGLIQNALTKVGVGVSVEEGLDALLNG